MVRTGRTPARTALLREYGKALPVVPRHLDAAAQAVLNPASQPPYLTPILSQLNQLNNSITRPVLLGQKSVVQALQELDIAAAALLSELQ